MSRIIIALLSFLFLIPQGLRATAQLQQAVLSKVAPSATSCTAPPASTTFSATDTAVYLYFDVTGVNAVDTFVVAFYGPSGQLYTGAGGTSAFPPATSAGESCYITNNSPLLIAGNPPATMPGTWTVYIYYNNAAFASGTFAITACSYSLSSSSVSVAATGGSGSFSVTASTGCAWTATSSVSWITTTSSGSGNGTVNYTVTANTSTSSRAGTITVGGQTFTVTQAGASGGTTTSNLIQNGDAESGPGGTDAAQATIPFWNTDGQIAVTTYAGGAGDLTPTSPGPSNRGNNYFAGGPNNASSKMTQTVDLSSYAAAIDAGTQPYTLDGWLGGYDGQDDNTVVTVTFQNASGGSLGTATIGPVSSADRSGVSSLVERSTSGTIPVGTRKMLVTVTFTRTEGSYNDGSADNLYFGLTGSSGAGSLNLNINQVISTSCPNNQMIVSVTDSQGNPVTGLTTSSFTLKEGGQTRTITVVPVGGGASSGSLSLAILIDTSGSLSGTGLTNEKAAAKQLISQMGASDMVAVYAFTDTVSLMQDFTSDKTKLNAAVDATSGDGNTALYQAVQTASQALGTRSGRKAIVLMTDGEDTVGGVTIDQAIAAAKAAGAPIFPVGFGSANQTILSQFATQTGGFYTAAASSADLQRILTSLGQVISSQYQISYTSAAPTSSNQIDITVTSGGQTATASRTVSACGSGGGTCTYSLNLTSLSAAATQSTALTIAVTAGSGCSWTAVSNVSWITVTSGASGTGNGTVTYSVAANTGVARTGTLTIAGVTFTVSQASGASSGCSYNVSPTDIHATAAGLSNTVLIFTNSGCTWTASVPSGVTWITLTPASGSGQGGVGYSIAANTGAARSTTITVAGVAVTVSQDASCTYTLSATSSPLISGVGGVGSVPVTVAGTNCAAWSVATPSVSWVHVAGGSGSTSSGTVSYSVDSNTAASRRSTTLTIANQSYTVQQDAAPCTYALGAASSGTLAAGGANGSFHVTAAGPACTWSITLPSDANSQWIHVISALNAMSSGDVSYTVDPNNTTSARSLALTVNGKNPATILTYTVSQAPGAANTAPGPIVNPNGISNAASSISANLPAGSIAQGSFFSIYGNGLGPANPGLHANSYPLSTNLGGVSVKVTQGSTLVYAIPLFVAQYQINAVMPSNTPTGTVQVTVSYNGATSAPAPVQVVAANFGAFAVSGGRGPGIVDNYVSATQTPLNTTSLTAAPGDYVILWGTGLGPLPGGASDAQPPAAGSLPASVQVLLGNLTISPSYAGRAPGLAGVDQIDFQLPSNVSLGCYVPLQVVVNGNASNTVTMAINNNRQPCSDTSPFSATARSGGKNASIALARLSYTDPLNALKIGNGTVDIAMGTFNQSAGVGDLGFSLFASLPPLNTCTYYNDIGSLNGLLGGQMPSSANAATPLDAGPTITVQGPNGTQGVSYSDSSAQVSPYLGVLGTGGGWTALGLGPSTPFLDAGTYTVSGRGGKDVGPFQYTIQIPNGATWTNRDSITAVDRSKGLTIRWSGGNSSTQAVAIFGFSSNPAFAKVSGGFACLSDMAPQSFTVPSSFLANLPATPASNPGNAISALVFLTVPTPDQFVKFSTSAPPSLDSGLGYYAVGELRNSVVFQ